MEKNKKIGEILMENNLISQGILDKALEYQKLYGGNLTQYLLAYGYIDEEDLAKCISFQFGCPYLPLRAYEIPTETIKAIPSSIAEKYWLIPVDKIKNIITVVMANPVDEDAIREIEELTNCKVQPFVGILSDILKAIERYYNVRIEQLDLRISKKAAPLFIDKKTYTGDEHRKSVRISSHITIHFAAQDAYRKSVTKDISMHGFLFESLNILPVGSFLVMEIDLPNEVNPYPIAAVVQVVRVIPLGDKGFDIGVKIINIPKDDLEKIINYASTAKS